MRRINRRFPKPADAWQISAMPLRCYRPPIRRVQEEYCAEVARRLMRQRRGPRPAGPKTPDNSEPWNSDPRTVSDLWAIAQEVQALAEKWGPQN